MRTWRGSGSGIATSFQTRTSGGPYFVRTTAFGIRRSSKRIDQCLRRSGGPEQTGRQHDVDEISDGVRAGPVALQLARESDPADRSCSGLHDAFEAGAVRPGDVPPTASTTG